MLDPRADIYRPELCAPCMAASGLVPLLGGHFTPAGDLHSGPPLNYAHHRISVGVVHMIAFQASKYFPLVPIHIPACVACLAGAFQIYTCDVTPRFCEVTGTNQVGRKLNSGVISKKSKCYHVILIPSHSVTTRTLHNIILWRMKRISGLARAWRRCRGASSLRCQDLQNIRYLHHDMPS